MIRFFNPDGVAAPASRYHHGAEVPAGCRWLVASGQVGVRPDGAIAEDFAAQIAQCFANVEAVLAGAGMTVSDVVKLTVYAVPVGPETVKSYREARDRWLSGHAPAATYIANVALADPRFLVEVEAVAAKAPETGV